MAEKAEHLIVTCSSRAIEAENGLRELNGQLQGRNLGLKNRGISSYPHNNQLSPQQHSCGADLAAPRSAALHLAALHLAALHLAYEGDGSRERPYWSGLDWAS